MDDIPAALFAEDHHPFIGWSAVPARDGVQGCLIRLRPAIGSQLEIGQAAIKLARHQMEMRAIEPGLDVIRMDGKRLRIGLLRFGEAVSVFRVKAQRSPAIKRTWIKSHGSSHGACCIFEFVEALKHNGEIEIDLKAWGQALDDSAYLVGQSILTEIECPLRSSPKIIGDRLHSIMVKRDLGPKSSRLRAQVAPST